LISNWKALANASCWLKDLSRIYIPNYKPGIFKMPGFLVIKKNTIGKFFSATTN